jgi:hypothetical protein
VELPRGVRADRRGRGRDLQEVVSEIG